jgi:hypothetical protein
MSIKAVGGYWVSFLFHRKRPMLKRGSDEAPQGSFSQKETHCNDSLYRRDCGQV